LILAAASLFSMSGLTLSIRNHRVWNDFLQSLLTRVFICKRLLPYFCNLELVKNTVKKKLTNSTIIFVPFYFASSYIVPSIERFHSNF